MMTPSGTAGSGMVVTCPLVDMKSARTLLSPITVFLSCIKVLFGLLLASGHNYLASWPILCQERCQ